MAQPSIVSDVVLTLRCGHPYRGGVCRRAVGWIGHARDGELTVEALGRSLREEWSDGRITTTEDREPEGEPANRWWVVLPRLMRVDELQRRRDELEVQADCDRHGACRFTTAALDGALAMRARDLTSA
jgi:hypothetical protein